MLYYNIDVFFSFILLLAPSLGDRQLGCNIKPAQTATSTALSLPSAQFALSLYDILKKDKAPTDNIFYSPLSISTVLSMALLGARGKTAEELSSALHYPSDFSHEQFGTLLSTLSSVEANSVVLHIANGMFTQKGLSFLESFSCGLTNLYSAEAKALNFSRDPNGSRLHINRWIKEKTKSKIKNLLPPGSITPLTVAVLVNAVYFKGDWKDKFRPAWTKPGDFKASPQKTLRVNFMSAHRKFPYGRNRDLGFQVLQLPYKGDRLSMVAILPFHENGLDALESKLSAEILLEAVQKTYKTKVKVTLPKFKIKQTIDLTSKLRLMGISDLFTNDADLSGVTTDVPLKVSEVVHESFIEVNEEGAEAAAVTSLRLMPRSRRPSRPLIFKADHPFLFGIFDNMNQVFLFWGRIAHPTEIKRPGDA